MLFIFNLAKAIAWQVEAMYKWLVSLIIGELIHGERHEDSKTVILAFSIFIVLAVFSFYMEEIVGLYTFIGIASLVLCQLSNLKIDVAHNTRRELLTNYFHESCLVIFLLVFNSFLPKAGHFIMFWAGPWFGIEVPTLMLDLSFSGIWSIFAIDIQTFDVVYIGLFLVSIALSFNAWLRSNSR